MENINPLISIITTVKNGEEHLEECFESLQNQSYKNFEHIVIDGGSTDRTLEIINNHKSKIKFFSSQKDEGIYDGFNKGMEQASGDYLGFLNSDDILLPDALMTLKEYIVNKNYPDFIFGSVRKHWGILHGYKPWKIKFSWGFYSSHSTGFYIKNSSSKIIGKYDLRYKYSSDYDYFYRMIVKHKMRGVATKKDEIFGIFRRGGFSSKINFVDHFKEEIQIRIDNGQNKIIISIISIYKFMKHFNKFYQYYKNKFKLNLK
tara:strand:+ start:385 stop:1164 length:780 start_codon:yes stop_codon:yes gene_type:complete